MSGKIEANADTRIAFRNRPRSINEGPLVITKGPNGEIIEQRIDPEWTSYMNRRSYIAPRLKVGPFSYDIDESGEPVPKPLLPDKFHPLSYAYRLKFDQEDWEPRVYCIGIPKDHETVIFSDILPDRTWLELKEETYDHRDLNRQFPLIHYMLHKREKIEPEKLIQEYNEAKKKKELEGEKERLLNDIEENSLSSDDFTEPSVWSGKINKSKRNTLPRRLDKKPAAHAIKSYNTTRAHDAKPNKALTTKKKKRKKERREFTDEERLYFEIHGCSYEQFIERKQKDIKRQLGISEP